MESICEKCVSAPTCAGAAMCLEAVADVAMQVRGNRMEIIQNGACAYMSPRPYGLWVPWHLVAKLLEAINQKTENESRPAQSNQEKP